MSTEDSFRDCGLTPIDRLPNLADAVPAYVPGLVSERLSRITGLPLLARQMLQDCRGTIIDVGPGEGISSMALGAVCANARIIGIEMDCDHLQAAWPMCRKSPNLQLFWGTLPSTPSNPRIKSGDPASPRAAFGNRACRCNILFSWIGMSRRDIFEPTTPWSECVENCCVLVVPRIWRNGLDILAPSDRSKLDELCDPRIYLGPDGRRPLALLDSVRRRSFRFKRPRRPAAGFCGLQAFSIRPRFLCGTRSRTAGRPLQGFNCPKSSWN